MNNKLRMLVGIVILLFIGASATPNVISTTDINSAHLQFHDIKGNIYYATGEEDDTITVAVYENEIGGDPVGIVFLDEPGKYRISVPNGEYYVFSYMNVNGGEEPHMIIDPMGVAINKTIIDYLNGDADIIMVSDSDVEDVDITLYAYHDLDNNVFGEIYYDGEDDGEIYIIPLSEFIPISELNKDDEIPVIPVDIGKYGIALPDGIWYLLAFMDTDGNKFPTFLEEPIGFAINKSVIDAFLYEDIDPIEVSGDDIYGVDITLYDAYDIKGNIYYNGPKEGTIFVGCFIEFEGIDSDPLYSIEMDEIGEYSISMYEGIYCVGAFMDVNGNNNVDIWEPVGLAVNRHLWEGPDPIFILEGDAIGKDITLYQPGDLDDDFDVDIKDLHLFLKSFGKDIEDPLYNPNADFDRDGMVNLIDFQIWLVCYRTFTI